MRNTTRTSSVSSALLSTESTPKATTLRINLNIDDAPIASRVHTHPSHSQTSRLLIISLSLGIPFPRSTHLVCARHPPALALSLSPHRDPFLYISPSRFINYHKEHQKANRKLETPMSKAEICLCMYHTFYVSAVLSRCSHSSVHSVFLLICAAL
jgi:hypothetical protein